MRDDTCPYLASTKQVNQPCETGQGVISPIWRRAKHSLLEVVGSQARGAGGRAIGEGLKSPGDLFLRNLDGRGRGSAGRVEMLEIGCLASISARTSLDGWARPAEVRL